MTPRQTRGPEGAARVVVVGSGIAGATAALHAADAGCRVTLITKADADQANTRYAQGGIAAVMFDDDRIEDHIHDTLVAGAGLCDPAAVRVLAEEGPARIRELVALGVAFDRDDAGTWVKGLEAAHSYPRILHAGGDATGLAIESALLARLRAADVTVIEHALLVDLNVGVHARSADPERGHDTDRVTGVTVLIDGEHRTIPADAVILATGGAGQLYAHTTNPAVATGDGIAAALRAGATVADLEFFQFHPTVLPRTADADPFLVSEAVRGEGAVLRDGNGQRFMPRIHPDAELAPRDVVARAIADVMAAEGGGAGGPVFLDATALRSTPEETAAFLARRFPTIDRAVRDRGLDWAREPIPVTPAAHYLMGGIVTDLHGRTSLPGLYAVGEVARTGVHGANRLASNSLLEGAVFGARAGDAVAADVATRADVAASGTAACTAEPTRTVGTAHPNGQRPSVRCTDRDGAGSGFTRAALQELLWRDAGLVRDAAGLTRAHDTLAAWQDAQPTQATTAEHEDANLLLVATALVAAARARTESVGAHFRADAASSATPSIPHTSATTPPDSRRTQPSRASHADRAAERTDQHTDQKVPV